MHSHPVALVTGGSRGIGRASCLHLARAGFEIAVNFFGNETAARETQTILPQGRESLLCRGDVGDPADRRRLMEEVLSRWGRLDVLVNNAGITSVGRKDLLDADLDSWHRVLGTNLEGPFFLCQAAAGEMLRMLQSGSAPESYRPCLINISSLSAYAPSVNRGDYCVSKAGLSMVTQLFALRLAAYGIRVYEVRPGIIATDMTAGGREKYDRLIAEGLTPQRVWGTPDDVGSAVRSLVEGALPFSTGNVVDIDGGFHMRAF